MLNKHLRIIIAVCLATFCVITGSAQAAIQKIVDQLEKEKDISVTYSERRNPSTKKIVSQSTYLSGRNRADADKLWKAFEEERKNSVSVTKERNSSFIIKFENKEYTSSYILSITQNYSWTLVISRKQTGSKNSSSLDPEMFDSNITEAEQLAANIIESIDNAIENNNLTELNTFTADNCNYTYTYNYRSSDKSERAAKLREQAAKKREQAAIKREQNARNREQAAEARRQAAEARVQASQARREAAEARRQAAEARRQAAEARRQAARNRSESTSKSNTYTVRTITENGKTTTICYDEYGNKVYYSL